MFLFVNGRCCESSELHKALAKVWRARVAQFQPSEARRSAAARKFPFLVAHAWLRPDLVDVNRSPDKRELLLPEDLQQQLAQILDQALEEDLSARFSDPSDNKSSGRTSTTSTTFTTSSNDPVSQLSSSPSPPDLLDVLRAESAFVRAQKAQRSPADPQRHPPSANLTLKSPPSTRKHATPSSSQRNAAQLSLLNVLAAGGGDPGSQAEDDGEEDNRPIAPRTASSQPTSAPSTAATATKMFPETPSSTGKRRSYQAGSLHSMARHEGHAAATPASTSLAKALVFTDAEDACLVSPDNLDKPPHSKCSASEVGPVFLPLVRVVLLSFLFPRCVHLCVAFLWPF